MNSNKLPAPLQKLRWSICFLNNEEHTFPVNYILYYFYNVQGTQHTSYSFHDLIALSVPLNDIYNSAGLIKLY